MAVVTITGGTADGGALGDNRPWKFWAASYQADGNGGVITTVKDREANILRPVGGVLTFEAQAGIAAYLENPEGRRYLVTIPEEDASLWDVIEASIAFPPDTAQSSLDAAVGAYVEANRAQFRTRAVPITEGPDAGLYQWVDANDEPVGEPVELSEIINVDWDGVTEKPENLEGLAAVEDGIPERSSGSWSTITAGTAGRGVLEAETEEDARNEIGAVAQGAIVVDVRSPAFGAADDGVTDDTEAINDALTFVGANGGGVVLLGRDHLVSDTLVVPELTTLRGHGGHSNSRGTVITSSALSGPVVHMTGRSGGVEHLRITSTSGRRAAEVTDGHGIFVGGEDSEDAYPFFSRMWLSDVDIRDQPTDGLHVIAQMEFSKFHLVTVSDCVRHGYVMDGGAIAEWENLQHPPFIAMLERCRAIECGGQALICLTTGGLAPHGLLFESFEALGCAWDSDQRNTTNIDSSAADYQIQLGGRGHIINRLDVEDQQYANSSTTTGGHTRTALSAPAKGVFSQASAVQVNAPFFSSLSQSWQQSASTSGLTIKNPRVIAGTYGVQQSTAIVVPTTCLGVDIEYNTSLTPGATVAVQNQSKNARIVENGVPRIGLATTAIPGWGDGLDPVEATISSAALAVGSRRIQVNGEGAAADNFHTMRIAPSVNGYRGLEVWLYRGAEDITVTHGTGNIRNASGGDIVMTSTANTVLHYIYDGTNWVQAELHRLTGSAALNFGEVAAQSHEDLTITVTGAATGDAVALGVPTAAVATGVAYTAWVSAANTVTVRAHNYSASPVDPSSGTFKATIVR